MPFGSAYRAFWLGLGAVAFDFLVAIVVTSILRVHVGHRVWRAVHWLAYACWPVAVLHGLGTGSDAGQSWMLLIDAGALQEAQQRLEPLAANDRTFRHTAREFLVLAAWRAGDSAAAKRWFDMIMTDAQTPAGTRSRVEMLMTLGATASKS